MSLIFSILIGFLGLLHLIIMCLEMFAKTETQANAFDMPQSFVAQPHAKTALVNQGIYNGALGLLFLFTLFLPDNMTKAMIQLALAVFVLIVGLIGGFTATKKIFLIQALPAIITIIVGVVSII